MTGTSTGRTYADRVTPVPFPAARCESRDYERREHAPHSMLTHECRTTDGHADDHKCICGRTWPTAAKAGVL